MKKHLLFTLMASLCIVTNICAVDKKSMPGKGDEIETLKNSTLVIVLLEESQKYEDKLSKQHKPALIKAYQEAIKTVNTNMQAMAEKYLKLSKGIEYKTMSEIVALPTATREGYSFLVYDRSAQFGTGGGTDFNFDFYAEKEDELKGMLDDYLEYIQFDCADPKYHGEEDYRRMEVIVKGKKKASENVFVQSLDMIIPTNGSFALCFMGIQNQFNSALAGDKKLNKEETRQKILQQVAKARTKTLIVCKDNLERNITEAKIGAIFKYKFKIVTRDQFDNTIMNNDTCCCLLVVYPADKTQGGYKPIVNYQHLIMDAETADVLVTVVPEATGGGVPPSYQKVTDKHFKDIVKAEDDLTK